VTSRLGSIFACAVAISLTGCPSDSPEHPGDGSGSCTTSDFTWATAGGGPGQGDGVTGTALAPDGSVWVTGTFIGSATWGTSQLTAADTTHASIFVAKLDSTGKVVLARVLQAGTAGIQNIDNGGTRIRVDTAGNPVVVGKFQKMLDVDGVHLDETMNGAGNGDAFVIGLDGATGAAKWGTQSIGNTDGVVANDVAIDTNGDVYVTGSYNGNVTFGSITVVGTSSDLGVFVAKYSPATNAWVWAKGWAGAQDGTNDGGVGRGIAVTNDGIVYVAGSIAGTLNVDGTVLSADGGSFAVKLAQSDGSVQWRTQIAPTDPGDRDWAEAATVDGTGALYITGHFEKTATFASATGGTPRAVMSTSGSDDMFLAKYDLSGALAWVSHAGVAADVLTRGDDVAFDGQDLYVVGFTQGDAVFSNITLPLSSTLYVAKYDTKGKVIWAQNATQLTTDSSSSETATVSVTSPTSGVVIGGFFDTMTAFGKTTLTGAGEGDAFVASLCN